jgi:hypothetical protein
VRAQRNWSIATLLITAGGLVGIPVFVPNSLNSPGTAFSWLLLVGSSMHVASSGWFLTERDTRGIAKSSHVRYIWAPLVILPTAVLLALLLSNQLRSVALVGFFAWQLFHFQKQNVGLASLMSGIDHVPAPKGLERQVLVWLGLIGSAAIVANPHLVQVFPGWTESHLIFNILRWTFAAVALAGLAQWFRRPRAERRVRSTSMYFLSLAYITPIFLFSNPYRSIAALVIVHGCQYLILVACFAGHASTSEQRWRRLAIFTNMSVLGGVLLRLMSHGDLRSSGPSRFVFGLFIGITMAHFVFDAGFWRLSIPTSRALVSKNLPWLVMQPHERSMK